MIVICTGTRPNFAKVAPIIHEFDKRGFTDYRIVDTGQHYDYEMSRIFYEDFGVRAADSNLRVGSCSQGTQIAVIMLRFEVFCLDVAASMVIVVGDTNSSFACALAAQRLGIPVVHIEAGLRSGDLTMPEEMNRILIDQMSTINFCTEQAAVTRLVIEHTPGQIELVGNVAIDALHMVLPRIERMKQSITYPKDYIVATVHREANVKNNLEKIMQLLVTVAKEVAPVVFPIHPRTRKELESIQATTELPEVDNFVRFAKHIPTDGSALNRLVYCIQPVGYVSFLYLMKNSRAVITDSGGLQAETSVLGVPCVTLRKTTEMPITVTQGTNVIADLNESKIVNTLKLLGNNVENHHMRNMPLWDGKAAERIVNIIEEYTRKAKK